MATNPINLTTFDAADYLETDQDIQDFLEDAFDLQDHAEILHALGVVARAKGMTEVARRADLGRESLYKALRTEGHPEFATVLKVARALGVKLKPVVELKTA
jgi:probable addiction module antidote protein